MIYKYTGRGTTTNAYVLTDLGFVARSIIIAASNDNTEDIKFSFDATTLDGEIAPGEPLSLNGIEARYIWIKSTSAGMGYRLWAWA
jgi:hypothetical protein